MARPARNGRVGKPIPLARKANAAGYAKRHARKAKTAAGLSDVYEYQSQKVRRSNIALTLDRDEAAEFDHGSDDDIDRDALRARLIGENQDDEKIDSDDDEELDSDEAFEESDEERFAGFSFNSKVSVPEEEEEEEGEPDEFIDVLDVLDGRGEPDLGGEEKVTRVDEGVEGRSEDDDDKSKDGGSSEDQEESDGEGSTEGDPDLMLSADEEDASGALEDLGTFITSLETGKKRKADATEAPGDTPRRKKRIIEERTEAGAENEFAAHVSGSARLYLDDLLAPLASQSSNLLSLKQSAKVLTSSKAGTVLSAPLPQRTQERLDRQAAYEQTKEEAEHLSFPLQAEPVGKTSNLELAAKFKCRHICYKPTTEMESAVDQLLKRAKMREEDIAQVEELKMNHLSAEEVAARRAEVRKVRELMFRAEAKAKRIAKIKSKTYRRIKKKEREKLAAKLDGEMDEDDEEVRMKREAERALERATLRHKVTGKWAKAMKGRGDLDQDQRMDVNEMLERGERLRRRIRGEKDSGDESGEGDSDVDEDVGVEGLKAHAFEEVTRLKVAAPELDDGKKGKSVLDMKFMRDAATREQQALNKEADDFIKELGAVEDDDAEFGDAHEADNVVIQRTGGRLSFKPGQQSLRTVGSLASDTSSVTLKSTDLPPYGDLMSASPTPPTLSVNANTSSASREQSNPWLMSRDGASSITAPRKMNELVVGKDSKAAEKSKNKLQKQQRGGEEEKEKEREDAVVEIALENVISVDASSAGPSKSSKGQSNAKAAKGTSAMEGADDSDENSEVEEQETALERKGKGSAGRVKAFEQRDLVARAFAGDNVIQEFEEAKRREIQADAPKTVDTTLPGWGSWGGRGAKKQAPKPQHLKKVAGVDPKSRADYGKAHVIISEKRDKKAAKYTVKDLPYPYTSKAQYERSLGTPLGTEWNTRVSFQRGTLPKVTKKMGTVINPLEKLF
ncbi:hypothetical protein EW146_g2683 [Bondarzewia mesenterica]|uniref:Utp14-domain-containing protein n=1 Tax=Bondarzewia mesenterica TaxID=1095465 RepID=A0A4S4M1E2_9AGAM|nr:hypothetical protein EW146_g2683 [Bondarzewia mesenterica]